MYLNHLRWTARARIPKIEKRFLALFPSVLLSFASACLAGNRWETYRNDRYGYSLSYPADIFTVSASSSNDSLVQFTSNAKTSKLTVFGAINTERVNLHAYREKVLREFSGYENLKYGPVGENWFVLSGYRGGGIYYQKVLFSCGAQVINALAMTYPIAEKREWDSIVTAIERNFRPASGRLCPNK